MKCVVIAAGYATRLGELTKNFPKPLLKIGENTILGRMLDDIDQIPEIDEHIIITNHKFAHIFEEWAKEVSSPLRGEISQNSDQNLNNFQTKPVKKQITIVDDGTEGAIRGRDEILTMYLKYAERANNWDLVDLSAPKILGAWLLLPSNLGMTDSRNNGITEWANTTVNKDYKIRVLDELAQSDNLWKQRMSIVCSWKTSQMGDPSWCLRYAEIHLHHPHDLMHKAVGWMLREMGKRCSMELLRDFLRQHAHEMPRTMLRYAIEKMSEQERQYWMKQI